MTRFIDLDSDEIIVDLFAGGGGASAGIELATGRSPDVAVNHDEIAIAVHSANHPNAEHLCQSVWKVDPHKVLPGRSIGLLWASPDCRHFSRAAGGRPKWKSVRSLPGVVLTWAKRRRPRVIVVENVREMQGWGPLLADGTPCPKRIGRSFNCWIGRLRGLGYRVEWKELCAADYGAPTIRTRLFIVARCDGAEIVWPQPTHGRKPGMFERPWNAAAGCIDWSIPCRSIFDRARPLKPATMKRIADGVRRYVLGAAEPFIVGGQAPHISSMYKSSVGSGILQPLGTITAQAEHHAVIAAHLAPITHVGENRGSSLGSPVPTLTCANRGEQAVVAAFLAQHNGGAIGHSAREPVSALTQRCTQQQVVQTELSAGDEAGARRVAAFLMSYYGSGGQHQGLRQPLGAVTTHDRFALVTVDGVDLPIVDIGMRMLTPAELAAAQGFPPGYVLDRGADGRVVTKTSQVRLIGNSVCPGVAAAVVRSQFMSAAPMKAAA